MSKARAPVVARQDNQEDAVWHAAVDEHDESDVEFQLDGETRKSEDEEELERLVFGDATGFQRGLKDFKNRELDVRESADENTGLEGLEDADVGEELSDRHVQPVAY